jgi:hypothetical protein
MKIEINLDRKSFLLGAVFAVLAFGIVCFLFSNARTVDANSQNYRECECAVPDAKGGLWYQKGSQWYYRSN